MKTMMDKDHRNGKPVLPRRLQDGVVEAVREAGDLLRAEFHRPGGPRGRGSHAVIDGEIDGFLRGRLLGLHDVGWLSEEGGRKLSASQDIWIVDPHDGTSAFLKGLRGSSISVALLRAGRPVLGVVYAPLAPDDRGDLFFWTEGSALRRNGLELFPRPQASMPDRTVVAMNEQAADYAAANGRVLGPTRFLAMPSIAYRLALAAAGDVDAAVAVGRLAAWDVAGGHALLRGSLGEVTDMRGRHLTYDEGAAVDGCIGGTPLVVRDLLRSDMRQALGKSSTPCNAARPVRRTSMPGALSRAQGVFLGQFAGDAVGSAVEFQSASSIAEAWPAGLHGPIDGGTWNTIAGQPTDDSELALALARSIARRGGYDPDDVRHSYVRWLTSDPFDIGGTTSASLNALKAGRTASNDSEANGSLMRISPIGVLHAGDPARAAVDAATDSALTHPSPVCRAACASFAAAIAVAVAGGDREAMWAAACAHSGAEPVRERLVAARAAAPTDFEHQQGWVLTALQNAFFRLMRGDGVAAAILHTVAEGGDTDTNAAIAGALVGAVEGRDGVPLAWRNLVLSCRPMRELGHHLPRPTEYWPDDALDLAEALLVLGLAGDGRSLDWHPPSRGGNTA
jgi:ADP-ribosyl-[dinitrogen reductase] hydrolase